MENQKKYFFNGRKIKDVQLLTIVPDISVEPQFNLLKSQLMKHISNSSARRYCLDFSQVNSINYISNSISVMMNFHRYCINENKESYFVSNPNLKPHLEKSQLIHGLFNGNVFDSHEEFKNFLSR